MVLAQKKIILNRYMSIPPSSDEDNNSMQDLKKYLNVLKEKNIQQSQVNEKTKQAKDMFNLIIDRAMSELQDEQKKP